VPSDKKEARYRVRASHPITDDRGRQFAPGTEISDLVLPLSDHNQRLVSSGSLAEIEEPKPKRGRPKKSESESESEESEK
jgi:hypothetical protein